MTNRVRSLCALGALCFTLCTTPAAWSAPRILALLSSDAEIYQQVLQGMRDTLREDAAGRSAEIHALIPSNSGRPPFDWTKSPLDGQPDLIVAIGTSATEAALASATETPLLSVLIPEERYDALAAAYPPGTARYRSAIFLNQPVERQLSLVGALFPGDMEVATFISPLRDDLRRRIEINAGRQAVSIRVSELDTEQNVARQIREILRESDLALAVDDPLTLEPSFAKSFLYTAYQLRKPVVAFSRAYLKAGALAAVFSTPQQYGRQAAEKVLEILVSAAPTAGSRDYARYFSVDFNAAVARSLGVPLPEREEITRILERGPGVAN